MKLIAAVSENWGIGKDNRLLFSIPKDMQFFREKTIGKTVILGRKNLESFPGGKPLKNRTNVVLTRDKNFQRDGVITVNSIDELLKLDCVDENAFVIGGESIYRGLLDYCDLCYITKVHETAKSDKFMVNLDESADWQLLSETEKIEDNGHIISFCVYKRQDRV
ncbi:MAG: dihydrofolate reductase [Clostridia bacterium]|nr:dihydrofolate reductase [Clostridia bacterium]